VQVKVDGTTQLTVRIVPFFAEVDATSDWVSADVHVHMNYAGTYRNTPRIWWSRRHPRIWQSLKICREQRTAHSRHGVFLATTLIRHRRRIICC